MELPYDTITTCDRCGTRASHAYVETVYMRGDPAKATGAYCPDCATDDNPCHLKGSWLLTWDKGAPQDTTTSPQRRHARV